MRVIPIILGVLLLSASASAQSTRTYEYDALGRLIKVTPSSGNKACYAYDAAGNRTTVTSSATCGSSSNSPPTANYDFVFFLSWSSWYTGRLFVLGNDTDPDLPNDTLTVTAVTGSPYASVAAGGNDVRFNGPPGSYTLTYTIKDSQNATSSAQIDLTILHCPDFEC